MCGWEVLKKDFAPQSSRRAAVAGAGVSDSSIQPGGELTGQCGYEGICWERSALTREAEHVQIGYLAVKPLCFLSSALQMQGRLTGLGRVLGLV